jgi:hypothetical protein
MSAPGPKPTVARREQLIPALLRLPTLCASLPTRDAASLSVLATSKHDKAYATVEVWGHH